MNVIAFLNVLRSCFDTIIRTLYPPTLLAKAATLPYPILPLPNPYPTLPYCLLIFKTLSIIMQNVNVCDEYLHVHLAWQISTRQVEHDSLIRLKRK